MTTNKAREARLAVQLRANLKRRKAAPIAPEPPARSGEITAHARDDA